MNIQKLLPGIKKNVLLKNYTTFKIGGRAKYFYAAKDKEDLIRAITLAKKMKLPFFILGGGSNLLISDRGFNGLVIKFGQPLSLYVSKGLEWAVGIPGTIQGAVCGNAGAFKQSMQDAVKEVEVFDVKTGEIKNFKNKDCQFSYKDSIFKKKKNLIILSVKIKNRASEGSEDEDENEVLIASKKSNAQKIKEYLDYRKERQPLNFPSAGSVFKNPPGFSAGELIDECGLKGKKIGNVKISEKHANFIVNLGRGEAKDVMRLIKIIKNRVKKKFGVVLEEEIVIL
ncbi:MAG: UDP-N-acetylenolpyruvoylglucosamine reductase [Candidatus Nealsonbacteria bacterium CG11_big_fil_rev_8_21_14_0_20_39_9]|uniref:UDP-N-acetylenolpyruvoylglucosamine reductase n=2 Tax=Candidatus Nealsoniibacteriota TaxID=1817911 RepID=A0A2H0MPL0_9BACT|nr:MAG: UDP-N-acetylenolpyruvoylglucosamine reductase [Candidatus Nealsonbacteria bacterium CG11_big_fil_rev_8_21_14_0_20_39_9]